MKAMFILFCISFAGAVSGAESKEIAIEPASIFALRDSLTLLNPTPRLVSMAMAELCVARTPSETQTAEKDRAGPHANVAVNYYVSTGGVLAMKSMDQNFPTGTIVLKEKLSQTDGSVAAIGGMVKRANGFDIKSGDWEYFYAAKSGDFEIGSIPNCVSCHAKAKSKDYVFSRTKSASRK